MALFQPTNIIPSSFTDGVVDANDSVQISWQVNGTSAMTAFKIDFYDENSMLIQDASTGKITDNIPAGGFYGTDRFGQPQMFTWSSILKWREYNIAFTNGKQYRFKITQWYKDGPESGLEQIEFSVFETRAKPTLKINRINGASVSGSGVQTIASSIISVSAEYSQEQGDAINQVQWILQDTDTREVINDTGNVNTAVLEYKYDGLFNGSHCTLSVIVLTASGVTVTSSINISISYTEKKYDYGITAKCNGARNAIELRMENEGSIPAHVNSENDYSYNNGAVVLKPGKTITWDQVQGAGGFSAMSFSSPYCIAIQFQRRLIPLSPIAAVLENHGIVIEQGSSNIEINETSQGFSIRVGFTTKNIAFESNGANKNLTILLTPSAVFARYSGENTGESQNLSYTQGAIKSISIKNTDLEYASPLNTAIFNYIAVYAGDYSSSLWNKLALENYEPTWNDRASYPAYFIAQFNGTLDGGFSSLPLSYHLFRTESGKSGLKLVRQSNIGNGNVVDFGVVSGKTYQYYLFVLDSNDRFYAAVTTSEVFFCLRNFSLVATKYDDSDGCYHVMKEYVFQGNISQGDVSNNNSPQFNENFTPYPTRTGSVQNNKSGRLQALIGYVNFQSEYTESMDVEEELYSLSTSDYILFLRDTKGHIRMVQTSAPIAQQYNLKTRAMQTTISLSWREVGDASQCSIVRTEEDY